ncbi:protein TsetseEP [Drosophila grimshawi]|uniref:GH20448 n=1 Tax=Drosophila grimshawi TaxID=7222 RepID=B4J9G5_DROGR|nr:protein TsetseEP [Drosophila grimshawi]EDW01446.1 GH20448 [Drosophila grimshawi]
MYTKLCVLLLAIGLSQAVPQLVMPEIGLMKFIMNSREISQSNPGRSIDCFNTYIPLMNQIAEDYKAEFTQCLNTADASREGVDESTKGDRTDIDSTATTACAALSKCSDNTGSVDYFECYANTAGDTAKTMYTISANSGELLAAVQEEFRLIDNNQYKCTNASERVYVEKQAAIFEDFDRCNKGLEPLTTPSPTDAPTTAPTTADTTPAPTAAETSAAPTTAETTPAPTVAETTAAPTTAETTAAPTTAETTAATEDNMPEEDLKRIVKNMKKWFRSS